MAEDLDDRGFDASPLHGDMQQVAREKALARFREGKLRVLVATDVAARGIDVADVTHVINYSCPEDEKTYVHRIGRTGRAGATGVAVTFVDWADVTRWKTINKALALPFENPAETYSTSEHFFHDMGIAPGTKGRLKPEKPAEPRRRPPRAVAPAAGRVAVAGAAAARPRLPRALLARTVPVATAAAAGPAAARPSTPRRAPPRPTSAPASSGSDAAAEGGDQPARSRNRRRRRSGSSSSSQGATSTSE